MTGIKKITSLSEIPDVNYIGFYWLSDAEFPVMVTENKKFDSTHIKINPFIVEAMLWDDKSQKSIMISHTGSYQIFEYNLKEIEGEFVEKEYFAHRLEGVSKVCFKQLWQTEKDLNCEDMQVLKMKAQIFIGFKNN
jgi:CRISPR type III-associated protein (TIGR04423 family)